MVPPWRCLASAQSDATRSSCLQSRAKVSNTSCLWRISSRARLKARKSRGEKPDSSEIADDRAHRSDGDANWHSLAVDFARGGGGRHASRLLFDTAQSL